MEEKIDPFSFGNRFLCGELDRIDAVECLVRARAQQRLQPRDDARTPGFGRFERDQALFELSFVDHCITPAIKSRSSLAFRQICIHNSRARGEPVGALFSWCNLVAEGDALS